MSECVWLKVYESCGNAPNAFRELAYQRFWIRDGVLTQIPPNGSVPKEREAAPSETSAACCARAMLDELEAIVDRNRPTREQTIHSMYETGRGSVYGEIGVWIKTARSRLAAQTAGVVATASTEDDSELEWDGPYTVTGSVWLSQNAVDVPSKKYPDGTQVQLRLYKEQK